MLNPLGLSNRPGPRYLEPVEAGSRALRRLIGLAGAMICAVALLSGNAFSLSPPTYMVFFDTGQTVLKPPGIELVGYTASLLKKYGPAHFTLKGHADSAEADAMTLSLRRANAVKEALVREGVPAASIEVVAKGSSEPLVQTAIGVREPQNRFVEIVIQLIESGR